MTKKGKNNADDSKTDASSWGVDETAKWLNKNGFSNYSDLFCSQHQIDGPALLCMGESDLHSSLLGIKKLGDIKRLYIAIEKLQRSNGVKHQAQQNGSVPNRGGGGDRDFEDTLKARIGGRTESTFTNVDEDGITVHQAHPQHSDPLDPEYFKLGMAFGYMSLVTLLTAYVMVVVHDRVPDMDQYPPLPDIMLDNIPHIPWAFQLCEVIVMALAFTFGVVLIFHKHRFIILRRFFVLIGSLYLMRCFTMWVTSMSVPGTHLQCQKSNIPSNASFRDQFWRAFEIYQGAGMSIRGVRTCGDYMFSGHTVMVTMLNFFITEYTPRKLFLLHLATWIGNVFGIFFILAGHEHYSIDVFIAFYLTTRLFLWYHSLANNRTFYQMDGKRVSAWFPLFSYFERNTDRIVPNEYEWPLPNPMFIRDKLDTSAAATKEKSQ